jgi:trimeric autotransporter adhesin
MTVAAKRGRTAPRIAGMSLSLSTLWLPASAGRVAAAVLFRLKAEATGPVLALICAAIWFMPSIEGQGSPPFGMCRVDGRVTSTGTPLPGVAIVATAGDTAAAATSTGVDGTYQLAIKPGTYRLAIELMGFVRVERDVTPIGDACRQTLDLEMTLAPRGGQSSPPRATSGADRDTPPAPRIESLAVAGQAPSALIADSAPSRDAEDAAARQLLPPGFSTDAPAEAVAFTGTAAQIDRGLLTERLEALRRGEFDPATGDLPPGFGGLGPPGMPGGMGPFGGRGGAAPGGPAGRGGGPGGRGDFIIGARGGRQNAFNATANYAFGGSALDASPYQLRADSAAGRAPYNRQTVGMTIGGPVKLRGIYDGTRRTSFTATYNGNRGDELFDQYATVPSDAMRAGNFAAASARVIDPNTGQPFANNQMSSASISPAARALLRFIPSPNLHGDARNYHYTTTTDAIADNVSARITHNFTPSVAGRGAGRGGRGFGGPGGRAGRGRGPQGTSVLLNVQMQYRRSDNERINVFPTLGGHATSSSLSLPASLTIARRGTLHNVTVNFSRTTSQSLNQYANVEDVAGSAGIVGVATDPFDWGVPDLSFSTFSNVRDLDPTRRRDRRLSAGYTWARPFGRHTLRLGGDARWDTSNNRTDPNARGAFVFTGVYASGGNPTARGDGLDFADFLLGLPQQASVQYGPGSVALGGRSISLFVQDDWRRSSSVTFNLGVRYELLRPFVEENGQMVNLDAAPDFSAVSPVIAGGSGRFTGAFPRGLIETDVNNIAPRAGVAWRLRPGMMLRGGYGISYNAGSYASIARQLVGQPPFAVTNTAVGTTSDALSLTDPLATASPEETTNNYGVARDYALGVVQTWNADISKDIGQAWNAGAGYTHTRGSSLDILRAPNRGPEGLRIDGVQPFLWQSSEGSSILHAATVRLRRRPVKGIAGGLVYTLARSRDNASTLGGGGTMVAQNDQDPDAEWGLSSFDRRHHLSVDGSIELPFGENRPWLNGGGFWAAIFENWRLSTSFTLQSGTPYTPRVTGAAADVARGTNGTLRANYNGSEVQLPDPTIDRFFNTAAFSLPATGTFGSASRNMIIGPGSRLLNTQLSRDVRFGRTRAVTIQLSATNLLNMVNYATIDTIVNSPTFGQVLSVRPMRSVQASLRFRY